MPKRKKHPVRVTYADGTSEMKKAAAFRKTPYWRSPTWRKKRKACLDRDDHKCVLCGRSEVRLEAHHKTYERYGHERLADLVTLCQRCHATEHQWLRRGTSIVA